MKITKERYLERLEELKEQISLWNAAYLADNAEYQKGEKVLVTDKEGRKEVVVIKSAIINYCGDIEYIMYKIKKDGSESSNRFHYYPNLYGHVISSLPN